jgi:calcineurin-like phosphoesterase family protein
VTAVFIHLSDIHFGQERDQTLYIHDDVKRELIADAARVVHDLRGSVAHGVLVTGDIAYSGKSWQYADAAKWLDQIAAAVGCDITRIQMVPGNHDLDRDMLSRAGQLLLDDIRAGGAEEYEKVLSNDLDRGTLFARFQAYGSFSEGYDCVLDTQGRYSTNMRVELAPGRFIKFVRMNSSLLCHGKENDEEPELLVGERQFTIPRDDGEEVIVLIHHPLHWFKDSAAVSTYLKSRSRLLITGHEHNPKVAKETIEEGTDFMTLAAGAAVPSKSETAYIFTYNVIEFDWDEDSDGLAVTIHPRVWNPKMTRFEADDARLGGPSPRFLLGCPNFRACARVVEDNAAAKPLDPLPEVREAVVKMVIEPEDFEKGVTVPLEPPNYRLVLLRFFRDLTEGERLKVLSELDAIPSDSNDRITQAIERRLFDWVVQQGHIDDLAELIDRYMAGKNEGGR